MTFLNPFSKKTKKEKRETIIIDHREKNSLVVSELIGLGFSIEYKQLPVADYIIGDVAIERKTLADFNYKQKNNATIIRTEAISSTDFDT